MRLLRAIHSVNPRGGGPIEAVLQSSRTLQKLGHEVEILSLDAPTSPDLTSLEFPCHAFGPTQLGNYGYSPTLIPWLKANAASYDAVIVEGLWQFHGLAVWKALHNTNTPYFVFPHGMLDPWFKKAYPLKHLKKWLYWPWAEYQVLRDAKKTCFTTQAEADLARQSFWLYKVNEAVAPLGIESAPGDPEQQKALFFEKLPQLRHKRFILYLGRITPKKGPDLLIKAWKRLNPEQVELLIAGPPQDTEYLKQLQNEAQSCSTIHFSGMLTGDLKWGAFQAAEAFILPSHQENFGMVVAEALSTQTPVLTTTKVNTASLLEANNCAIVKEDTLEGVKELLQTWLRMSDKDRYTMLEQCIPCFQEHFEIQQASHTLVTLLSA